MVQMVRLRLTNVTGQVECTQINFNSAAGKGRHLLAMLTDNAIPISQNLHRHWINHLRINPVLKEHPISRSTCQFLGALTPVLTGYKQARSINIPARCLD
jgi:hypothetical protein